MPSGIYVNQFLQMAAELVIIGVHQFKRVVDTAKHSQQTKWLSQKETLQCADFLLALWENLVNDMSHLNL